MSRTPRKPTAAMKLRHALLSQWRGVEEGPLINLPAKTVGNVLDKVVKELGLSERVQLEEVLAAWRGAVGDFIARNAMPESISRGVLVVKVSQSSVHYAVSQEKSRLLANLNQKLNRQAIRDIRFRHG
jgi:predicted nucleic acid-binding Zn ribbon protein